MLACELAELTSLLVCEVTAPASLLACEVTDDELFPIVGSSPLVPWSAIADELLACEVTAPASLLACEVAAPTETDELISSLLACEVADDELFPTELFSISSIISWLNPIVKLKPFGDFT